MFYELIHPIAADYYKVEVGQDYSCPPHIHYCFEWIVVTEGTLTVQVGQQSYNLCTNDSVMIFPHQIHALHTPEHSKYILCVFSMTLVHAYRKKTENLIPVNAQFQPSDLLLRAIRQLPYEKNLSTIKGILYLSCGCFDDQASYTDAGEPLSDHLLYTILRFVEENYRRRCSLMDLTAAVSYDYAYLSKYFKKSVGLSFNDYVNYCRISEACYLLGNTKKGVLEISEECGYSSQRGLNRNFKEQLGMTPTEYRRQLRSTDR